LSPAEAGLTSAPIPQVVINPIVASNASIKIRLRNNDKESRNGKPKQQILPIFYYLHVNRKPNQIAMKFIKKIRVVTILFLAACALSCASTKKFPVSTITPAAEISVKIKQQKNGNYLVSLEALNLAEPSRLSPAKNYYVVWLVTEAGGTRNLGSLSFKRGRGELEAVSPFKGSAIFITAEEESNTTYPAGQEIARTAL
jgi:hypothetical protein